MISWSKDSDASFISYNMQGMEKSCTEIFTMLKTVEVEIKKEHAVLMVNKTVGFKKAKGKNGNFKKGGKKGVAPAKKPKARPKPNTEYFYYKGSGH